MSKLEVVKTLKLTGNKAWIVRYLNGKDWCRPTDIGRAYGNEKHGHTFHCYHSAWASPICLKLVKDRILKRNDKGHYAIRDDITILDWMD